MTDDENLAVAAGLAAAPLVAGVALSTAVASAWFEAASVTVSVAASGSRRRDAEVVAAEVEGGRKTVIVDAADLEEPEAATTGIVADNAVDVGAMR